DTRLLPHKSWLPLLTSRGYQPVEFSTVLFLPLAGRASIAGPRNERLVTRIAADGDSDAWVRTAVEGWGEHVLSGLLGGIFGVLAGDPESTCFLTELDGQPIAAGAMRIHKGVALLAGACTIPAARRQGAQLALLESRLNKAAECGCDLAMMVAEPGSSSQRNAERQGFRIAYTRVKWGLP